MVQAVCRSVCTGGNDVNMSKGLALIDAHEEYDNTW